MEKIKCFNRSILTWAREYYNLTYDNAARRVNKSPDKIKEWEEGTDYPTYVQLETLAELYKRPVAIFFFDEIPDIIDPKASFRSIDQDSINMLDCNMLKIINEAHIFQENLEETMPNLDGRFNNYLKELQDDFVTYLRKILKVTVTQQKLMKNDKVAFDVWREKFIDIGIYVFKEAFMNDDISGFCLYDSRFPIIYINNSLTFTRQIFTLFHELYHLVRNISGMDFTLDNPEELGIIITDLEIEKECNQFAGDILVPDDDFFQDIEPNIIDYTLISNLAKIYKVSREVINVKLYTKKYIDFLQFQNFQKIIYDSYRRISPSDGGGNFYYTKVSYLGFPYIDSCIRLYNNNSIDISQLCQYTNTNQKTVKGLIEATYRNG